MCCATPRGSPFSRVVKVGLGISGKGGQGVVVARTGDGTGRVRRLLGPAGPAGVRKSARKSLTLSLSSTPTGPCAPSLGMAMLRWAPTPAQRRDRWDVMPTRAVTPTAAIYTYSRSKGLFAGASLEGAVIATQKTANARYYGRPVTAADILSGHVARAGQGEGSSRSSRPLIGGRRADRTTICFTTRRSLRHVQRRADDRCFPWRCSPVSRRVSAQEQEGKLVDRILKPNMSLVNSAQNKQFERHWNSPSTNAFPPGTFARPERSPAKSFAAERAFSAGRIRDPAIRRARRKRRIFQRGRSLTKTDMVYLASAAARQLASPRKAAATWPCAIPSPVIVHFSAKARARRR